jgi:two-component system cell cycle response regulator
VRYRRDLSLLMFDIDHFKSVNDSLRPPGRRLRAASQVASVHARPRIRREDVFARYGGEEFAHHPARARSALAMQFAEKVPQARRAGRRSSFDDVHIPVTISVGAATHVGCRPRRPAAFIKIADDFLFAAKQGGRNQVAG